MFKTFRTAALSATLGLAAFAGATAGAQADSLTFRFGDEPRVGVYLGDENPRHVDDRGWGRDGRRDWQGRHHGRDRGWGRACTPERALEKAERMGLRRVRIVDVDRRTIEVSGRRYGDRQFVTFARVPHCPVIG